MACIINASTSAGLVQSADTSGVIQLQNNGTTIATVNSNGLTATTTAKAWVSVGDSGSIKSSYNVSSITANGTGDYTLNFTNAFSDTNYAFVGSIGVGTASNQAILTIPYNSLPTTTALRFGQGNVAGTLGTYPFTSIACFR
jgi:hypothetical protein